MKVLIDECAPKALKMFLVTRGHDCQTVQEAGWAGKQNGELLKLAESTYSAFVRLDTNLQYQQNLAVRQIAVILIRDIPIACPIYRHSLNFVLRLSVLFGQARSSKSAVEGADVVMHCLHDIAGLITFTVLISN